MKNTKIIILGLAVIVATAVLPLTALADTQDVTVNAHINSSISAMTATVPTVDINSVVPGVTKEASTTIKITSNNGYKLSIKDKDADLNLVKGSDNIAASANTFAAPNTLATNTWGYRVVGVPAFGTNKYAGITAVDQQIAAVAGPVTDSSTEVFFGVNVDATKPSGTYTDVVTFTATAN